MRKATSHGRRRAEYAQAVAENSTTGVTWGACGAAGVPAPWSMPRSHRPPGRRRKRLPRVRRSERTAARLGRQRIAYSSSRAVHMSLTGAGAVALHQRPARVPVAENEAGDHTGIISTGTDPPGIRHVVVLGNYYHQSLCPRQRRLPLPVPPSQTLVSGCLVGDFVQRKPSSAPDNKPCFSLLVSSGIPTRGELRCGTGTALAALPVHAVQPEAPAVRPGPSS